MTVNRARVALVVLAAAAALHVEAAGPTTALLQPRSLLPSLANAGSHTMKCGVLASWLESGRVRPAANAEQRVAQPPEALDSFRDEQLLAVFGKVYDDGDGRWRDGIFEAVIAPCIRPAPAPRRPMSILPQLLGKLLGGPDPAPDSPEVARLQRYGHVLRQAFNNQPGSLSATAITAHVRQVREHVQRANALAEFADAAPADLAAFRQLAAGSDEAQRLVRLMADDRKLLVDHLAKRRSTMAPAIVQAALARAESLPRTLEGASQLIREQRELTEVLSALSPEARQAPQAQTDALIDASVSSEVRLQEDRLTDLASTPDGARQLVEWERAFDQRFGEFAAASSVRHARQTLSDTRTRILTAVLPEWRRQVAATPTTAAAVSARRADLAALVGNAGGPVSPIYAEFMNPLVAREAALKQQQDDEEQARLRKAQRSAAVAVAGPAGVVPLQPSNFQRPSGTGGDALSAVFEGSFDRVPIAAASLEMSALVSGYIGEFSNRCRAQIVDAVELTRTVCDAEQVTTQGRGIYEREISPTCVRSHEEPTGVFAERSLDAATRARPTETMAASFRTIMNMMAGGNPIGQAMGSVATMEAMMRRAAPRWQRMRATARHSSACASISKITCAATPLSASMAPRPWASRCCQRRRGSPTGTRTTVACSTTWCARVRRSGPSTVTRATRSRTLE